jgi:ferric-dicitrate binding protein FerR (iron transport regulator)
MESGKPKKDIKQAYRTSYLLAGYIKKTLTAAEHKELNEWIEESDHNRELFEELTSKDHIENNLKYFGKTDIESNLQNSKKDIQFNPPRRNKWLRPVFLIAASILLAVVLIYYFRQTSTGKGNKELVNNNSQEIEPVNGHAVLTFSDGRKITLPSGGKDTMINAQATASGSKPELTYNGTGEVEYHTLSVPAGTTYKVKLADGTLVHLNAISSIRYPTSFPGDTRQVIITGEAYFEVVHDVKKPFIVEAGNMRIEDLGTAFDVNSYEDIPGVNTTLVSGSISVSAAGGKNAMLSPGEQAVISRGGVTINKGIDTVSVIAWKNNQFRFVNTPLQDIMRQVGRWYDAEVVYEDSTNVHLNATIERNVPVSKLLHLLSETGDVHFKIDRRKIIVSK